jgi:class 3 adenylate cyclase/tetratricopeptide (TPR) repeat protein
MESLSIVLAELGLERYAETFVAHGVDAHSLPLLNDADLAELGVLLGHRRLLLSAVARATRGTQPVSDPESSRRYSGERRQLTVLFCDLVGSTALAQGLDAEELRDLMRIYQEACARTVTRFEGHVAQYLGDGLVVYFGYPRAHEHAAQRAVRAALEIIDGVTRLPSAVPLHSHIGIATGPVVIGDPNANDPDGSGTAVGVTPNLAARLCAFAGADEIVIAPETGRLLDGTVDLEDLGSHVLKGLTAPVRLARVLRVVSGASRFSARNTTSLIGRRAELGLLDSRWETVRDGEGQAVLLVGEPGLGKSRIARAMSERLADQPHQTMLQQCSPLHKDSAFHPIVQWMNDACRFDRHNTADAKLDRLEAVLQLEPGERDEIAPLFAALLSLPIARYASPTTSPQRLREATMDALICQALRRSRERPLLIILEDAQWADPDTLETMALLIERIRQHAILLIVTCRPEFSQAWPVHGNVTLVHLNRLARREGAQMAAELTASSPLPPSVLDQILERADGVPLFVEELTQAVIESGRPTYGDHQAELAGNEPPLAIPLTLYDSLMARLDRVPAAKTVAQLGACIGREFDRALLDSIAASDGLQIDEALHLLQESGLLFRSGSGDETVYRFKHALVGDVAYESLLKSQRLKIHARIATALESAFDDRVRANPELLALHLTRAGKLDRALSQWLSAARSALTRNRPREALRYVESGLALVEQVDGGRRTDYEAALLVTGTACHWSLKGYGCPEVGPLSERVETLLDSITQPRVLVLALAGISICAYASAQSSKSLLMAERAVALVEKATDVKSRIVAYSAAGPILYQQGQYARCAALLREAIDSYDIERPSSYGQFNDGKVSSCCWLSHCYLTTGRFDESLRVAREAIDHAETIGQPFVLAQALSVAARAFAEIGDAGEARELCRRCIGLCEVQRIPFWKGWAMVYLSVVSVREGRHDEALTLLDEAIAHLAENGGRNDVGYIAAWRVCSLARLGRFEDGRLALDTARAECRRTGQPMSLIELAHADGVLTRFERPSSPEAALMLLESAVRDAQTTGQRLVELRASIEIATILCEEGLFDLARARLQPVLESFTEGEGCAPMTEAHMIVQSCRR